MRKRALIFLSVSIIFLFVPKMAFCVETVMDFLELPHSFRVFIQELQEAKLHTTLENNQGAKHTVFVPTDDAFNKFGMMGLVRKDKSIRNKFLKYHIIKKVLSRKKIKSKRQIKTLSGNNLDKKAMGKIAYSIPTKNGIIHIIDHVLINPEIKNKLKVEVRP
jgi:uncharacterized surface protein with fasciclin (FAS1) repeats